MINLNKIFLLIASFCILGRVNAQFEEHISFTVVNTDGIVFVSNFSNNNTLLEYCDPTENITITIHGWREGSFTEWVQPMIGNFSAMRGGCVMFMDYYYYSKLLYPILVSYFAGIHRILTRKLQQLEDLGYDPNNFYLFGFSFGAHVAFEGAYNYGFRKVNRVDACDPAGPYFTDEKLIHAYNSSKNVQCLHTSTDFGTYLRYCQKDVLLGNCGITQDSALLFMSHEMCPILYLSAFVNDFRLVPKSVVKKYTGLTCKSTKIEPDVTKLNPTTCGPRMNMSIPDGQYYALTSRLYPYNVV